MHTLDEYSLTVTESALIQPDGSVTWYPAWWEVRLGSMGESVTDAIHDSGAWWHLIPHPGSPVAGPDAVMERVQATPQQLLLMGVPAELVARMQERELF